MMLITCGRGINFVFLLRKAFFSLWLICDQRLRQCSEFLQWKGGSAHAEVAHYHAHNGMANEFKQLRNACVNAIEAPVIYGWDAAAFAWVHEQEFPGNELVSCRMITDGVSLESAEGADVDGLGGKCFKTAWVNAQPG